MRLVFSVLLLTVLCVGTGLHSAQAATVSKSDLERRAFKLINQHRVSEGLDKLKWNDHVASSARNHSKNMAHGQTEFGHDGFEDRVEEIRVYIPRLSTAGENVAYTTQPSGIAKQIVQLWLDSEGHRSNIENEAFEVSGMGVGKHGDYYYFTQLFVGKD